MSWSKATFRNADELKGTIELARQAIRRAPDGIGIFKAREGLTLFFSPIATASMTPDFASGLSLADCARPDEMAVEIAVGPYDDPVWYDQAPEDVEHDLDVLQLDELGLLGPDTEIDKAIDAHFANRKRAAS